MSYQRYRIVPRRRQEGVVAVIVGIVLVAMIAMAGLALDLGQLYVVKAELQNAADACALSAIQSVTGSTGQQLQIGETTACHAAQLDDRSAASRRVPVACRQHGGQRHR